MAEPMANDPKATESAEPTEPTKRGIPDSVITLGLQIGSLLLFLLLWQAMVSFGILNSLLFPSPLSVIGQLFEDLLDMMTGGPTLGHFTTTLSEIVIGFGAAAVGAIALGALLSEFATFRRAMYPYVIALSATPRIAFAPLFIIWFGFGLMSKVVLVATIAAFPILVNTMAGIGAVDVLELKMMRSLGATRWQIFWKLRVPTSLPYVFAGLESGIIFAAVGAVVAEFTSGNSGLGYLTLVGQEVHNLPLAFSAIVLLAAQGLLLHRTIVLIRRRVVFWRPDGSQLESTGGRSMSTALEKM